MVALRRGSTYTEQEVGSLLSTVSGALNLLLLHTKRPVMVASTNTTAQRPGPPGWRKALAQTLSGETRRRRPAAAAIADGRHRR